MIKTILNKANTKPVNNAFLIFIITLIILVYIFVICIYYVYPKIKILNEYKHKMALAIFSTKVNLQYKILASNDIPLTYYNTYINNNIDLKLSDFYIASSFKSYLPLGLRDDIYSINTIEKILEKGARFINLDIYSDSANYYDKGAEPIVGDNTLNTDNTTYIYFKKCCSTIMNTAWLGNNYPLFLYITLNHKNIYLNDKIATIIEETFIGRLPDTKYNNIQCNLGEEPVKNFLGKIIIITNNYPNSNNLDKVTHSTTQNNLTNLKKTSTLLNSTNTNTLNINKSNTSIYIYEKDTTKFGGLEAMYLNIKEITNNNKTSLSIIHTEYKTDTSIKDYLSPGSAIFNIPPDDAMKYGFTFIAMNYQLYDENMKKYISIFSDCSFKLKPENLRYIQKPEAIIEKQNIKLGFGPQQDGIVGWYKANY